MVGRIDFLDEELIDYRQHGNNQIGAWRLSLVQKILKKHNLVDYNARQERRAQTLLQRVVELDGLVPASQIEKVRQKLSHTRFRLALPRNRLARIRPVLREVATGRYGRYSTGILSIARDLIDPP